MMSLPKLLFARLRRSRPLFSLSPLSSSPLSSLNSHPSISTIASYNFHSPFPAFHFLNSRSFSSPSNHPDSNFFPASATDFSPPPSSSLEVTDFDGVDVLQSVAAAAASNTGYEESILPVRFLISVLDGFHDITGLPWWLVIASATVAMRLSLFPLLVLQLHKFRKISEFFPKLPPPFPPPFSGKSFVDQISLFRKERRAMGCPSYLWFAAYFSVQVPCFLLWMSSIRRMSLDHHPGFDCGGILWFQNLTEYPHGISGPIFPLLIACLHYINVQLSFKTVSVQKTTDLLSLLAKYYKLYLDILTLPLFFIGYCIPQGSLVYWVTNSSLTAIQQISMKHPVVRARLGLLAKDSPAASTDFEEMSNPLASLDATSKPRKVFIKDLNPKQLLAMSVQLLSNQNRERAIHLLQLALEKDPDYVEALVVMGLTLLKKEMYAEAREHLEHAISKLFIAGNPTEVEYVDLVILASQWAAVACVRQGNNAEGVMLLERVASLEEPDDPKSKGHYFDALFFLASALSNEGRKAEAEKYLRLVDAFNPAYKEQFEQLENEDEFGSDLVNSRRRDY